MAHRTAFFTAVTWAHEPVCTSLGSHQDSNICGTYHILEMRCWTVEIEYRCHDQDEAFGFVIEIRMVYECMCVSKCMYLIISLTG